MTSDNKKYGIKRILSIILPIILMLLFLYLAFNNINFGNVLNIITHISMFWFFIFLLTWFFSHLIRAYRWRVIIHSVKPDTSILNLLGAIFVGYGVNCAVPRLGELYRPLFLGRWENISRTSMIGTIIVERVIDFLILGISILVSVIIYPGNLFSEFSWLKSALGLMFTGIFAVIIFLYLLVRFKEKFYNVIISFVSKISEKIADKLAEVFHLLIDGFSSIKTLGSLLSIISLSVIMMLLYGFTSYIGFLMLRMNDIQPVTYGMAWVLMTISAFGVIIPTPGATGSYHWITKSVLVGLFNFGKDISSAFAILTHLITYIMFILTAIFFAFFINKKQAKKGGLTVDFLSAFKARTAEE
ncbi:hypothetical protein BMS3Abin04_01195 [bacterium BMS3Abin04]|nr:hypothetical protein BMS3Abin04_01195 [bacterium BMS3Abin04]